MGILKNDMSRIGYDQEEIYFYKLNRELIEKQKRRAKLTLIQGGKSEKTADGATEENGDDSDRDTD